MGKKDRASKKGFRGRKGFRYVVRKAKVRPSDVFIKDLLGSVFFRGNPGISWGHRSGNS